MTAPAPSTSPVFEPEERRTLDRAPAEVFRKDDAYEVRAGDSRIDGLSQWEAYLMRDTHNRALVDQEFAASLRATREDDATWTDAWLTRDEARAACPANTGGVA